MEINEFFEVLRTLSAFAVKGKEEGKSHPALGRFVVVRGRSSGVNVGELAAKDGEEVHLKRARRIWSWTGGALSCSEIAMNGVTGGKIAVQLPDQFITDAIEVIPGSEKAEQCLRKL